MIAALGRVARAPGLVLVLALAQLVLALLVGTSVRSAAGASLGRFAILADGHLLSSMLELMVEDPGVFGAARQLLAGSAVLALVLWTVLAAGIIERLRAPLPMAEVAAAAVRGFPGVLVVTLWHLVPRAVVLAAGVAVAGRVMRADTWGWLGGVLLVAVFGYTACALDLARCNVVLHGARRFHPMTAVHGFVEAARRPGVLVPSVVMSFGQWACVLGILTISIAGLGTGWAPWLVRGLAIAGVVFGVSRIAVAVGAGPPLTPDRLPSTQGGALRADPGLSDATPSALPPPGPETPEPAAAFDEEEPDEPDEARARPAPSPSDSDEPA